MAKRKAEFSLGANYPWGIGRGLLRMDELAALAPWSGESAQSPTQAVASKPPDRRNPLMRIADVKPARRTAVPNLYTECAPGKLFVGKRIPCLFFSGMRNTGIDDRAFLPREFVRFNRPFRADVRRAIARPVGVVSAGSQTDGVSPLVAAAGGIGPPGLPTGRPSATFRDPPVRRPRSLPQAKRDPANCRRRRRAMRPAQPTRIRPTSSRHTRNWGAPPWAQTVA